MPTPTVPLTTDEADHLELFRQLSPARRDVVDYLTRKLAEKSLRLAVARNNVVPLRKAS